MTAVSEVRVFAGYAGWGVGQLEAEVAEGSWWVLDALPSDAFTGRPEALWPTVLRRQGPPLAFAAGYPEDPTLN
jgi:putative transcriptional regulator